MKVTIPPTNVAELVNRAALRHPSRTALVDGDRQLSWAELDQSVDRLAAGLVDLGLVAGRRVALAMLNSWEFVSVYLAVLRAGMVAVPITTVARSEEITHILTDSGAQLCLADADTVEVVRGAVDAYGPGAPSVVVSGARPRAGEYRYADVSGSQDVFSPRDPESLAVLMYTAGTNRRPQAAMLSHRALLANIEQNARIHPAPMTAEDVVLGTVPLCHLYGLNAVLGQVLSTGATLVLGKRFDPEEALQLIAAQQTTLAPVSPPMIAAWARRPDLGSRLAGLRLLLSGGGWLPEDVVRRFEDAAGVVVEQGYGLTEAAPVATTTLGTPHHKPGSVGRPLPGVDLRVVDDDGTDTEPGDPGEVWLRGRNLFSGYWPDGTNAPAADGWLPTGDLGYLDEDGDLFLVDRLKEAIVVMGFTVYPSEVEEVIAEVDGVAECAVVGEPDADSGQRVAAYVVAADTATPTLDSQVVDHCRLRLARFKVPTHVRVVDALPRSVAAGARHRRHAVTARRRLGLT